MSRILVHGATTVDSRGTVPNAWVIVSGGEIAAVGVGDTWTGDPLADGADRIDAAGRRLLPGFLDLHCHGIGGISFDTADPDGIETAFGLLRARGTTGALVSLVASAPEVLEQRLRLLAPLVDHHAAVLGVHLEGPFLAPARKGAHDPALLVPPTAEAVDRILEAGEGTIRQVTLAPDLPGAFEALDRFVDAGVIVSIGHTEADYDTVRRAFDRGARSLTHAFNAMPGIHHRAPGPVMAAVATAGVTIELILDGEHVAWPVAKALFALAPDRVALVSDSMAAAGMADGDYRIGDLDVEVESGVARLAGTSTLAGSTLTLDRAVDHAIEHVGLDESAAVAAATSVPASLLRRQHERGYIEPGLRGDLLLVDEANTITPVG
ncbi:N-acetylglucosamine-6-phosphate deacetylase [Amnibacterium flavum]|uniref:N-acetylglucosamine-6-phosphate deacetylase n=1 Tax=Amnibacterium flavum TaxID=2173173 RepID=A0A2V1HXY9_9MICO|nr:N-acetylglucosamine-6-phosphate deacetylase [Amnibacterium flavum]